MAEVISVTNQKGGVAKTTTAIELAFGLARQSSENRVLLIDLDSQRNATGVVLGRTDFEPVETVFTLFQGKEPSSQILHSTRLENLLVMPSALQLVEVESMLSGSLDGFFRLSEGLETLFREFNWVIFDCPPSLSIITINAMVAARHLVVPLQISKFSLDGINGITDAVKTVKKRYNPYIEILGGLLTMFDPRTTLSQAMGPEIESYIPVFETRIPRSVVVEEAHLLKKDLYEYAPAHKITKAYSDFTQEVTDGVRRD